MPTTADAHDSRSSMFGVGPESGESMGKHAKAVHSLGGGIVHRAQA